MKKVLLAAGVIALGTFATFGILLYKIGESMAYMHRCGCHARDY